MGSVLFVLDSNAIMSDPSLAGTAWKLLAHAATSKDTQLAISEVSRLEVIAGYSRRVKDAQSGLHTWTRRNLSALGMGHLAEVLHESMVEQVERYESSLDSRLSSIPVELLPIPEVEHIALVSRAVNRVPPCDDNGDGYRDTLIWLSVLKVATERPDEKIILVTADKDFVDATGTALQAALLEELQDNGLKDRVKVLPNLQAAALSTLASIDGASDDLSFIRDKVERDSVEVYIRFTLLEPLEELSLSARDLALPIDAVNPAIDAVVASELQLSPVRSNLSDDQSIIEATLKVDVRLSFERPSSAGALRSAEGGDPQREVLQKTLIAASLITVDAFGRPVDGELTSLAASEDDPGRADWRALDAVRSSLLKFSTDWSKTTSAWQSLDLERIQPSLEVLRRALQVPVLSPELAETIRQASQLQLSSSALDAIRNAQQISLPP